MLYAGCVSYFREASDLREMSGLRQVVNRGRATIKLTCLSSASPGRSHLHQARVEVARPQLLALMHVRRAIRGMALPSTGPLRASSCRIVKVAGLAAGNPGLACANVSSDLTQKKHEGEQERPHGMAPEPQNKEESASQINAVRN
jgi:hypothetical protein